MTTSTATTLSLGPLATDYKEAMRFRLRTLLIVLALGPPVLWGAWFVSGLIRERLARAAAVPLPPPPHIPLGSPAGIGGPHVVPPEHRGDWLRPDNSSPRPPGPMADLDLPFRLESFSGDQPPR